MRALVRASALLIGLLSACGGGEGAGEAGGTSAPGGAASAGSRGSQPPPSVILLSIDTLRADHLGLYGYERDTSPYLDRLAQECLVFDRAYTTAPWTLIAHMSMMTGLEPAEHGVVDAKKAVSPQVPMLAERLREHGYRTLGFYFGEWLGARYGFRRGFEVYRAHKNAEQATLHLRAGLEGHNPNRPLFLFAHLFDVHTAAFGQGFRGFYDPPPPFDTMFLADARERLADVPCAPVWLGKGSLTDDQVEGMVALYDGGVRYIDGVLEDWIEGWRAEGLLDRSLLILTADHGESLGQRGLVGGHGGMYEEGLRIPLLIRFPDGYRAGEREQGVASVIDYPATVLDYVGLDIEPWRGGRSLAQALPAERVVLAERDSILTLIGPDWKVTEAEGSGQVVHLSEDGAELNPYPLRSEEGRPQAVALRRAHRDAQVARVALPGAAVDLDSLDQAARRELQALGYVDEVEQD
ncbi:MAG: sulfatase [Planctomycetota bacterium]